MMKLPKRWSLVALVLLLSFMMILTLTTSAQEPLTETFTATDGTFTFNYPAGWFVDTSLDPGVALTNSQAAAEMLTSSDQPNFAPGDIVLLLVPSVSDYPYFPSVSPDATAQEAASTLWDSLASSADTGDLVSNGPAPTTIGSRSGVQVNASTSAENLELMLLVIDNGDSLSMVFALTAFGGMEAFQPTIRALAETLAYTAAPSQADTSETQATLPDTPPGMIAYGDTVGATMTMEEGDRWTFTGSTGDVVRIALTSDFDNYLEVYDLQNNLLASDDDSGGNGNALIEEFALSQDGTYTIVARSFSGDMGQYTLNIELVRTIEFATPGMIAYGDTVEANLTALGGDRWTFMGSQGDLVSIRMTAAFDNYLELYDPANNSLISDDDSGGNLNAYIAGFTLPADGMYTIVAKTYGSVGGVYNLELTQPELIIRGHVEVGQAVQGTLVDVPGERWLFKSQGDEQLTIAAMSDVDTILQLYDAGGNVLFDTTDSYSYGYALIDSMTLPSAGEYTIVVRPRYAGDSADYTLMVGHPAE